MKNNDFRAFRPLLSAHKRSFSPRGFLGLSVVSSFLITLLYFAYGAVVAPLGSALRDGMTPVMTTVSHLSHETSAFFEHVYHLIDLSHENMALKREKQEQHKWQVLAEHLKSENLALREMLNVVPENDRSFITSRVFSYPTNSAAEQKLIIRGGLKNGLEVGSLAFFEKYAVGRVVSVGSHTSEVLLFTDISSKVPVKTLSGSRGLLKGGGSNNSMKLTYTDPSAKINVGDKVITSADGHMVDAGYALGTIAAIKGETIDVRPPYDDVRAMTYVQVVSSPSAS